MAKSKQYSSGTYTPKNPQKYVGVKKIHWRSSWEHSFMMFCDTNVNVIKWASESITIPYIDPLTDRKTIYIPDFFIQYIDKNNVTHMELIEIKPSTQQILEKVGNNRYNAAQYVKNQAKWAAAKQYCAQINMVFRVLNESDLYHMGGS